MQQLATGDVKKGSSTSLSKKSQRRLQRPKNEEGGSISEHKPQQICRLSTANQGLQRRQVEMQTEEENNTFIATTAKIIILLLLCTNFEFRLQARRQGLQVSKKLVGK